MRFSLTAPPFAAPARRTEWGETVRTVGAAVLLALGLRVFGWEPFSIPSASMEPTLEVGDYLFVAKWPYGFSRHAIPGSPLGFDGRWLAATPKRGDVVVFKTPRDGRTDYIKRVIGLPGDRIRMADGVLWVNGVAARETALGDGRIRETLPSGRSYVVRDGKAGSPGDDTATFTIPAGQYFMLATTATTAPTAGSVSLRAVWASSRLTIWSGGRRSSSGRAIRAASAQDLPVSEALQWAESELGHRFADPALLERALTHPSLAAPNYQRLEFLGDRVLGLTMAAWLYEDFGDDEGRLTRRATELVSGEMCAEVARAIGVGPHLRVDAATRGSGIKDSTNVLGDVCEALIAALWLDGGWDAANGFVRAAWAAHVEARADAPKHPKSALQEWAATRRLGVPNYELVERSGPHHQSRFRVRASVRGQDPVEAEAASKQEAERLAAQMLVERLGA